MSIVINNNKPITNDDGKTFLNSDSYEYKILGRFNWNPEKINQNQNKLQERLTEICTILNDNHDLSHEQKLTQLKTELALERFKLAGVPSEKAQAILVGIEAVKTLAEDLDKRLIQAHSPLTNCDPEKKALYEKKFPKIFEAVESKKYQNLVQKYNFILSSFLTHINYYARFNDYEKKISEALEEHLKREYIADPSLEEELLSYYNWMDSLCEDSVQTIEFFQGDDINASLGDGVCRGMAYNFLTTLVQTPSTPLQDLTPSAIPSRVRFNHARYILTAHYLSEREQENYIDPPDLLKRDGLSFNGIMGVFENQDNTSLIDNLSTTINANWDELQKGNPSGILSIFYHNDGLKGHAFFIRFDEKRERYIFCDPNMLRCELSGVSREKGIEWLKKMIEDVTSLWYPPLDKLSFINYQPIPH